MAIAFPRRSFLAALLAAPLLTSSQRPPGARRISVLGAIYGSEFDDRLRELGFAEGRGIGIERPEWDFSARGIYHVAREAVRSRTDVIVACGSLPIRAAIDATRTIPIVMAYAGDPIGMKFVSSLARPGGNVTGVAWDAGVSIAAKTVEVFKEALPEAKRFAILWNTENPAHKFYVGEAKSVFERLGLFFIDMPIDSGADVAAAFQRAPRQKMDGIIVIPDHLVGSTGKTMRELASTHRVPILLAQSADGISDGMLIQFGPDVRDHEKRAADYVARILKGARPGDLPIEQTSRVTLAINLKTAARLNLRIPDSMLQRADEVVR